MPINGWMRTGSTHESPRGQRPTLTFFGIAFAVTWSLWWTAAITGRSVAEPAGLLLYMAGGLGPLVGTAWILRRSRRAYRRAFLQRVCDPRLAGAPWWLALLAVAAGPTIVGATVAGIAGVDMAVPSYGVRAVGVVIAMALLAGLVEEPGWRGVALDAWQRRMLPAWAATGIGALWALWHLPLAFIDGTYYHALGFASLEFWLTNLALVQTGVLYAWLVNGTGGSIFIAVLAHAGFNAAASLVPRSPTGDLTAFVAITVATVVVVVATKGRLRYSAPD